MTPGLAAAVVLAFPVLASGLMLLGWRARGRRTAHVALPVVRDLGAIRVSAGALYLASTHAGAPLERVVTAGLSFRGRCELVVAERGVHWQVPGEPPVVVPAHRLVSCELGRFTIDRVSQKNRMLLIRWRLDDCQDSSGTLVVESAFGQVSPALLPGLCASIRSLITDFDLSHSQHNYQEV